MTKSEISKRLAVPLSTIKDWSRPDNRKHGLFLFLSKIRQEEFESIDKRSVVMKDRNEPKYHRLLHIVNRNSSETYTLADIKHAFDDSDKKTIDDQLIIESFFKECDEDDYKRLLQFKTITKKLVKSAYRNSPSSRSLYHDYWDKVFHIMYKKSPIQGTPDNVAKTNGMSVIKKMRELHA